MNFFRYKYILAYVIGVAAGSLFLCIAAAYKMADIVVYGRYIFQTMNDSSIDMSHLILNTLYLRGREIFLILLIGITRFGIAYGIFRCAWYGITIGLAVSTAVLCYGVVGVFIFLWSIFPYIIPLVAMMCLTLKIMEFHRFGQPKNGMKQAYLILAMVYMSEVIMEAVIAPIM